MAYILPDGTNTPDPDVYGAAWFELVRPVEEATGYTMSGLDSRKGIVEFRSRPIINNFGQESFQPKMVIPLSALLALYDVLVN